jgi:chaperonin GroES
MQITKENKLRKLVLVGDKVLIKPKNFSDKTKSGLLLPQTVLEKEDVHTGTIVQVGPGYPMPNFEDDDESWKPQSKLKYLPLQAQEGDVAVFLQKGAYEVEYDDEKYLIVPHHAILMLVRDEEL